MKSKTKILFVIESLTLAGSERSCLSLLNNLKSDMYNVDLQLFRHGCELEEFLNRNINILPALKYTDYVQTSWKKNVIDLLKGENWKFFKSKFFYSLNIRRGNFNHPEKAQIYWETVGSNIQKSEKSYDIAIAFAQGIPTFYVLDKIKAKRKVCWINANMIFLDKNKAFNDNYYSEFDRVVAISEGVEISMLKIFPNLKGKIQIIPNIIDSSSILKMANLYQPVLEKNLFNILTVGRLNSKMKGMDITIEACKVLKGKNIDFHWYIVGEGSFRNKMEEFIKRNQLQNNITLLGATDNPYPYFKAADLYVQTSRHEGYGRTIAEARMLNLPIVTTNFDTVGLQIRHLENGIITDITPESVAEGVIKIMNDKKLYNSIKENLKKEPKDNTETVELFDAMIKNLLSND